MRPIRIVGDHRYDRGADCVQGRYVGADRPARIVAPTPASRAELERVVSAALDGVAVQLADDALVHDSLLIIEPRAYRDAQNNRIMGRDSGVPTQFRLLKHGEQCILERHRHARTLGAVGYQMRSGVNLA